MKNFINLIILLTTILYISCVESNSIKKADYHTELSTFLSTKATFPLEETVWMEESDNEFHKMLLFKDGNVSLFYGLIDNGEMQRWSDYYSAPYNLSNSASFITTELTYPIFGEKEFTEILNIIKSDSEFFITTDTDTYKYVGNYSSDLEERWTLVYIGIEPWN